MHHCTLQKRKVHLYLYQIFGIFQLPAGSLLLFSDIDTP